MAFFSALTDVYDMLKSSLNIGNQTSQKERPFIAIISLLLLVLPSEVFVIVKMADYLK
jgi:hypothetical protein